MERVLAQRYTAGVITAFCRNNQVDPAALPQLVGNVLATWLRLDLPAEAPAPDLPVTKAKRGRPVQPRVELPSRRPRKVAVADTASVPQVASSRDANHDVTEPVMAVSPQTPAPEPVPVPPPVPAQSAVSTSAAEETLPDRDSPEMKRHTIESVFGKPRAKRQNDAALAQGSLLGTEPGAPRTKRTPFSQQSVRRLRS